MSGGQESLEKEFGLDGRMRGVREAQAGPSVVVPIPEGAIHPAADSETARSDEAGEGEGAAAGAEEEGEGEATEEGTEGTELTEASSQTSESAPQLEAKDLQQYSSLQSNISELQGLQVAVGLMQARQQAASLEHQLAAARKQVEEMCKELAERELEYNRLSADRWYPGKRLVRAVTKNRWKDRLEASEDHLEHLSEELPRQQERVKELEAKVEEAQCWIEAWQGKDEELATAQRAAAELERQISRFMTVGRDASRKTLRQPSFGGGVLAATTHTTTAAASAAAGAAGAAAVAAAAAAAGAVKAGAAAATAVLAIAEGAAGGRVAEAEARAESTPVLPDEVCHLEERLEEVQQRAEQAQQALEAEQEKYVSLSAHKWYPGKVVLGLATNQRFHDKLIENSKARLDANKHALEDLEAEAAELASQLQAADSRHSSTSGTLRHGTSELVNALCMLGGGGMAQEAPEEGAEEYGHELAAQVLSALRRIGLLQRKLASARQHVESCSRAVALAQQGCDHWDNYSLGKYLQRRRRREAKKATSEEALAFFTRQLEECEGRVKELEVQLAQARQGDELVDLLCSIEDGNEPDVDTSTPARWRAGAAGRLIQALQRNRQRQRAALRKTLNGLHFQSADIKNSFPEAANAWNVVLDVPLTAYMFPYNSKFMGPLHKLQIGPVLHAFYRFGPMGWDPKGRDKSSHGPALPTVAPNDNGRKEGRLPLFMLSGLGSTMISWGVPLLRALACNHEVVIMEYRGAGLSVNSGDEPWTYYNQAQAMINLADALGIPKFNILGWSSGGNTGLVLAAFHGHRLGRVVSLAGMAGGSNTIVPPEYEYLNPSMSLSVGQTLALIFPPDEPDFAKVCGEYIKSVFSMPGGITDQTVGKQAAKEQWAADQEFIRRDERVWEALPMIKVPVLVMNGMKDALVPPANAERLAARIPGAQLRLFPGWGHAFKEVPKFVEAVNAFLLEDGDEKPGLRAK